MNLTIVKDAVITGFLGGLISYLVSINNKNPEYLNMLAFLYAAPCIFFYMIFIASRSGKQAIKKFSLHAILGGTLTLFVFILTYYFYGLNKKYLVLLNLLFFLVITGFYFNMKIYKL